MNQNTIQSIGSNLSKERAPSCLDDIDPAWAWQAYHPVTDSPWNRRRAAHLLRRAGFGYRWSEIEKAVLDGPQNSIDRLFDFSVNQSFDEAMETTGQVVASRQDARQLSAWWLLQMSQIPNALEDRLTLFWHGHFATNADKVQDNRAVFSQCRQLRRLCLGSFAELVNGIARDPAMLIYLDTTDNRKTRPNENFARELLELFCLGPGNYTEADLQQLARCFTGWEVRTGRFHFNPHQYDDGVKSIFGKRERFNAEMALGQVIAQPACATFVVRKLVRYFISDELQLSEPLLDPLVKEFRSSGNAVKPLVESIFRSNLFFSEHAMGAKIRSPVELAIFLLRVLQVDFNMLQLVGQLESLGQLPFFPPNVKGWEGGRSWINAATLLGRNQLCRMLVRKATKDPRSIRHLFPHALLQEDSEVFVDRLCELWLAIAPPEESKRLLIEGSERFRSQPQQRVAETLKLLVSLPEFQLG
jgi:uncharacterized protein (DUF1800 family)